MSYRDAVIFIIFTEVSKLKTDKVGLKGIPSPALKALKQARMV